MFRCPALHRVAVLALSAALATLPALLPGQAQAQGQARAQSRNETMPQISGFDVQAIARIEPGAELAFTLWGTPGAAASLQIDGAQRALLLAETSPGVYQGSYTVNRRDRIAPNALVSANLRRGNQVGTARLDEPLQLGARMADGGDQTPRISGFSVSPGGEHRIGSALFLAVQGTPGARVSVMLPGAATRRVLLHEGAPGDYSATYTVQAADRLDGAQAATARLSSGERSVSASTAQAIGGVAPRPHAVAPCSVCGTVEAVNRIEVDGDAGVIGSVAGGLLGAVIGSQFGKGDGRTAAGVAGAVGGALLGRQVEKKSGRRSHYEVVVRLANGVREVVNFNDQPTFQVGDAVRLVDGALQPDRG